MNENGDRAGSRLKDVKLKFASKGVPSSSSPAYKTQALSPFLINGPEELRRTRVWMEPREDIPVWADRRRRLSMSSRLPGVADPPNP
jgi:hypothetical protein